MQQIYRIYFYNLCSFSAEKCFKSASANFWRNNSINNLVRPKWKTNFPLSRTIKISMLSNISSLQTQTKNFHWNIFQNISNSQLSKFARCQKSNRRRYREVVVHLTKHIFVDAKNVFGAKQQKSCSKTKQNVSKIAELQRIETQNTIFMCSCAV